MVEFTEPTKELMLYIADHLKKDDYREIVGLSGRTCVRDNLLLCAQSSRWARAALIDGVPVAAFGVYPTSPFEKVGCIWMLTTEATQLHKVYTGKKSKAGLLALMQEWDLLWNYVDAGNRQTIRWLEWMGAKVGPPEPLPPYGCLYRYFEFRKDVRNVHDDDGNHYGNSRRTVAGIHGEPAGEGAGKTGGNQCPDCGTERKETG